MKTLFLACLALALTVLFTIAIVARCDAAEHARRTETAPKASLDLSALIKKTYSDDPGTRITAIRELGALGEQAAPAVPALIRIWRLPGSVESYDAFFALNDIGEPAADACIAAVKSSSGKDRIALVSNLGHFKNPKILDVAASFLTDQDPEVRRGAARGLADCRDSRVAGPLIGVFNDPDSKVRCLAVGHFGVQHDPGAFVPLVKALEDNEAAVRERAAYSLAFYEDQPSRLPPLIKLFQNAKEEPNVRHSAGLALSAAQDARTAEPFLAVFNDRLAPANLRRVAAQALGSLKVGRAFDSLAAALQNAHEPAKVRAGAACALGEIGDRRVAAPLAELAEKAEDKELRFWAAVAALETLAGAIDDTGILKPIGEYDSETLDIHWSVVSRSRTKKAIEMTAKHGKTEAVRTAAKEIIAECPIWSDDKL